MYTTTTSSYYSDIVSMFDHNDFYNSAMIYILPRVQRGEYTMSYLTREDLVAKEYYGEPRMMGLVLLEQGETCHIEGNEIVRDKLPLEVIQLKSYSEIKTRMSVTVEENPMNEKSTATGLERETRYEYNGRGFTIQDLGQ